MNFLQGELVDGTFACPEGRFADRCRRKPPQVTAGLRPEDCLVTAPARARSPARVYALELIGDHTLVTCRFGEATLTVKADKTAAYDMDAPIGITFSERAVFLFDADSGERIRESRQG